MTGKVFAARTIWIAALALGVFALGAPFANTAQAQGSRKDDVVFNAQGRPMAGATVRVCTAGATGEPCSPLASIYSDAALTQALANPLATDGLGNYTFYAAAGRYTIEVSGPGITSKQMPNVILPSDPSSPTFTTVTTTSGISAFSLSLTGNLTVTGSAAVVGSLNVGGAPVPSTGVDNRWSASQRFKGPVPNRDLSAYMQDLSGNSVNCADSVNAATDPMSTMTIGSGSTSAAVVSSAATYKAGCGLSISGAGPSSTVKFPTGASGVSCVRTSGNLVTCTLPAGHNLESGFVNIGNDNPIVVSSCSNSTMNTQGTQINTVPSSTTVTYNSGGSNGTGTGCTVSFLIAYAHGNTGAVTYYYKVAAIDALDGVSPAVGPVTITNGAGTSGSGSASDNFMRANGGLGANWTTMTGFTAPTITSDEVLGNTMATHQAAFYNATPLSSGQDNKITYGGTSTSGVDAGAGVYARASAGGGYLCLAFAGNITLFKVTSGGFANLAEDFGAVLSNGDTLEIKAQGTILSCLKNSSVILTASDSSYTTGSGGIHVYGASAASVIAAFQETGITSPTIGRQADGFFDYNWIGWPYTGNARMFAIWRSLDNSTYTLVGCPQTVDWSDWGYSAPCPSWVPSTPPSANQPQSLKTTITNVSGSTLTLANAASNSVTAAPAYHDETTFLNQCLTDQKTNQALSNGQQGAESYCLIPPTPAGSAYYFNSDLPWDTLAPNGGAHVEVAGTMVMNTWPWHFSKGGYYIHGLANNTTATNFGTFSATQVYFGKHVPAAFVFTPTAPNGIQNLSATNLEGYGLMTAVDPIGNGGGGTTCFDDLYISEAADATGVPMRFGSNTITVNSCSVGGGSAQNINLEPRSDGFPASIIVGTDTYGGNGTFGISLGYTQLLYHGVYSESPGGMTGGGTTGNISVGPILSEDHGFSLTGGEIHIDSGNNDGTTNCSGGPCALPYGTQAPVVGGVSVNESSADSSDKLSYTVSGQNQNNAEHFVSGDNVYEGPICVHGSTICSTGLAGSTAGIAPGPSHYYIAPPGNDWSVSNADHSIYDVGYPMKFMGSGIVGSVFPAVMVAPAQTATIGSCSTTGGSLADGTYYFKVVREDNQSSPGTTIPSPETPACVISGGGGHGSIVVDWSILGSNNAKDARIYYANQPCDQYQPCYEDAYTVVAENEGSLTQSTTITSVSAWTTDSIMNHITPTATLWDWNCMFCFVKSSDILAYGYKLYGPGVASMPSGSSVGFLDVNLKPTTFSGLPTCNSGQEGSQQAVTDSTTNTWGATITGSGTNHVLAYCDGTNWTVAAK